MQKSYMRVALLLIVSTFSTLSMAQVQSYVRTIAPDGEWVMTPTGQATDPAGPPLPIVRAYDNWRSPSSGGNTLLIATVRADADEIADDVGIVNWQPQTFVADLGWTLYNFGTRTITRYRTTIRLYDAESNLLFTSSGVSSSSIPPGLGVKFATSGGAYLGANIPVSPGMFMSVQYSEVQGPSAADLGVLSGGPITLGSSSNFIYNFTTGQQIDLGPNNNLGFFIDAVVVPAPAGAPLLTVGVLAIARRRRGE
ncbi:MAG: hypothetical protein SFZ23_04755 [Planctomycetota bacterium]|nr:hypothetical protein [Planctomycetota bacterium]